MKKLISLALALVMAMGLSTFAMAEGEGYDLALITDVGTIDDKSFNQGAWEGVVQYAEEFGISHKYYQPKEQSDSEYLETIDIAVDNGAKIVVTPGYLFEAPIGEAQNKYPDVKFILIDGYPVGGTNENTVGVKYAEEQSGFLAGYAAVKEGYTKLGFMGGMAVPAVVRFGYGFVQGADYAAKEMGIEEITVNYHYTGGFDATPEAKTLAASWYNDGVEVIFGCGGAVGNSVMAAAEEAEGKWVIGVDVDQSAESKTVLTSATKGLSASVYQAIEGYYGDNFPGGQELVLGADNNGVELPMETSRFSVFTQDDYDAIFAKLVAGEIEILQDTDVASEAELATEVTKVTQY